jgi:hypothetical protein
MGEQRFRFTRFFTFTVDGGEWLASRSDRFDFGERDPGSRCTGGLTVRNLRSGERVGQEKACSY